MAQECAECARLFLALKSAEAEKATARERFDAQHNVHGAQQAAIRVRAARAAYESALAQLEAHRATHRRST